MIIGVRGKMPNPFTTPTKKYFENEEVAGLFKIFGYNGYSRKFDPDKFKPEKVIIMTDADADGAHIRCLIFGMFLRYLPFAIEQGKLYAGNPPLYGINLGKNKKKYFNDNIDYIKYVQELFCANNTICNINTKKKYSKKDITQILYKNMYYIDEINKVCGTYSIDAGLLEFILFNKDLSYSKFKSTVEKEYRFIEVGKKNNTILISGLVNSKIQTIFLNNRLINDCADIIDMINKSEMYYLVNGKKTSILELMTMFDNLKPNNVERYKGLGKHFAPYCSNTVCEFF